MRDGRPRVYRILTFRWREQSIKYNISTWGLKSLPSKNYCTRRIHLIRKYSMKISRPTMSSMEPWLWPTWPIRTYSKWSALPELMGPICPMLEDHISIKAISHSIPWWETTIGWKSKNDISIDWFFFFSYQHHPVLCLTWYSFFKMSMNSS